MISAENLHIRSGTFSLANICFEIPTGSYCVLMGRTGCGKTTILEALCGLRTVTQGRILLMGEDVTSRKPARRGIGYVPQEGALFSTMTVREHIAFALRVRRQSDDAIAARVDEMADLLGLGDLLDRLPHNLSGGEKQRVALGRALSAGPGILCLDEPLSALDDESKEQMFDLLKSVQASTGVTTLHITHSRAEAKRLADCVLQLVDGVLESVDTATFS